MRAQAEAKLGAKPKQKRTSQRTVPAGDTPGTCHTCAEEFAQYGAWERHSVETGHRRWDITLPDTAPH